ncbi:MAG: hypothetical protein ACOC10_04530 [Bacteroidota bacterium]
MFRIVLFYLSTGLNTSLIIQLLVSCQDYYVTWPPSGSLTTDGPTLPMVKNLGSGSTTKVKMT